ncbi:MAG: J domain-containing protein [Haloarculaceae archaeon]
MFEALTSVPGWLVWSVVLGASTTLLVTVTFLVGTWLFPTDHHAGASLGGETRRRSEIRQYLRAIGEQFAEDHPVCGQSVAFYLPERDVAITFDARAYYRIERSGTYAVLVEHELPGVHLGSRLPFETPDVSPESDEDGRSRLDPRVAAFSILGVTEGATIEEVKAAYRRKVKEVHPDHGGDPDDFKRVREAYTTARKHAAD